MYPLDFGFTQHKFVLEKQSYKRNSACRNLSM
jgi:hypothetical protein